MDIPAIISTLLVERDWTQETLAARLRTNQSNISRWLAGVEPRGRVRDELRDIAIESGLIEDERAPRSVIPIMGYIGAGAEIDPDFEQVPPDGLDQVELPFTLPEDMIGLQVKGDSMLPKYDDGDVIVVWREQQRSTASMVGEEAAVRTYGGHRFLKRIMPGLKPHTFNLESINARPIIGTRIAWASDIFCMVPARRVRKMAKRPRAAARARPGAGKGR